MKGTTMKLIPFILALLLAPAAYATDRVIINPESDGDLKLKVNDGGTVKDLITLQGADAEVGIGVANPLNLLHISDATVPIIRITNSTTARSWQIGEGVGTVNRLSFRNSNIGTDTMSLDADNNRVGVGILNPTAKLHVSGADGATAIRVTDTAVDSTPQALLENDAGLWIIRNDGSNSDALILRHDFGSPATVATFTKTGFLGLATTTPQSFGAFAVRKFAVISGNNVSASFSDATNSTFDIRHPAAGVVNLSSQDSHLTFSTGAGTPAERLRVESDGNVLFGAGTSVPTETGARSSAINVLGETQAMTEQTMYRASADNNPPAIHGYKARGSFASKAKADSGDDIFSIRMWGYDGTIWRETSSITAVVDGTTASGDMPSRLSFTTTPDGSATAAERIRIDNAGTIILRDYKPSGFPNGMVRLYPNVLTALNLADNTNQSYTLGGGSSGMLIVTNATDSKAALFFYNCGFAVSEISDPATAFTTTFGTTAGDPSNVDLPTNCSIRVENQTNGTKNYTVFNLQTNG